MFWFSKKKVIKEAQEEVYEKWNEHEKQKEEENKRIKVFQLEEHLGKLVICVSNEIQNVTVGYGKELIYITQAKQPQLVVHDIVNDCEIMPFGIVFAYTEQKFKALNSLEHNERIAILYNRDAEHEIDKSSSQTDVVIDSELWSEKVKSAIQKWKEAK
jgi:ribosomal protein S17E